MEFQKNPPCGPPFATSRGKPLLLFLLPLLLLFSPAVLLTRTPVVTPDVAYKSSQTSSPNLVIILTDDQGFHDVGFNGCTDIPTPNIDSIVANGVRFTNGYVSFPVCGPSRAGILTGRYQDRFGFTTNPSLDPEDPTAGIPHSEENIAEVLGKVGYESAIIGKWHLGSHPVNHPLSRGFDHFFGFLAGGHSYFPDLYKLNDLSEVTDSYDWYNTRIMKDREPVDVHDYLTDELTDAATAFILEQAKKPDEPFLLYLAYNAPHGPLQATEKYLSRFSGIENVRRRTYAAMISAVDDGVGRVLDALQENDFDENTLVVFLSDNGGLVQGRNGKTIVRVADNWPFRGGKSDVFEGGLHVPFAMKWKSIIPAGLVYTNPVISLDIMATITALAGAHIDPERPLDGVNLIPFLTNETEGKPHDTLFWRKFEADGMAIRKGDIKLLSNSKRASLGYLLFNLSEDVGETHNLTEGNYTADPRGQMLDEWEAWNAQLKNRTFASGDPTTNRWWMNRTKNYPRD